ncbi:hypothetical protein L7F22_049741 [Adiantum nelumboides]|nr:hypothetical protein [Adiantum nelumboides]
MALAYLHEDGDLKGGKTGDQASCGAWGMVVLHAVRDPGSTWRESVGRGAQGEELSAALVGLGGVGHSQQKGYFLLCRLGDSPASHRSSKARQWTEVLKVLKVLLACEREGPVSGDEVGCTCGLLKGITLQGQGGFGWPILSSEHVVYLEWLALSVRVASREDMLVRVLHADASVYLVHARGTKYSWFGFPDKKMGDQDSEECMQILRLMCGMRGKKGDVESYRGENHAVCMQCQGSICRRMKDTVDQCLFLFG